MEYDPLESFRVDEGELELTEEGATFASQKQAEAEAAAAAQALPEEPAPTGEEEQTPESEVSTEPQEEPFDRSKDFSYYQAQGMTRREWNKKRLETMQIGGELEAFAVDPKSSFEFATAVPTSVLDFGTDLINFALQRDVIPKIPKYENGIAQTVREISSILLPTGTASWGLKALTKFGKARKGWAIGNTPFMRFLGDRTAETLGGVTVGAVSREYEEGHNLLGMAKQALPPQYDFIPDSLATLDGDSPDDKRRKNILQDVGLGTVQVLAGSMWRMGTSMIGEVVEQVKVNRLIGNTKSSRKWLENNSPPTPATLEESVELGMVRLDEALDEVGQYNLYKNPEITVPVKGVHDFFDYNEVGVRTIDDFGIVGASIDQSRITRNLDSVDGRIGSVISEPAIKYGLSGEGNVDDVVLGLARQLNQAGDIGMEGNGWKISLDDQIDDTLNITADLFDPRMSRADVDRIIQPFISQDETGKQVLSEEGFGVISKALRGFGDDITSMDVTRAHSLLAGSLSGRVSDLAEGARLMEGTPAVEAAQEKVIDLMKYLVQLSGSAEYYKNRKIDLLTQVRNGFKNITGYNADTVAGASELNKTLFNKAERFGTTLASIAEAKPQLMKQFLMAYELTDGKVSTIRELNQYIFDKSINLGKAILDPNPEVDNKLLTGVWNNIYASYLSAFKTPLQAVIGGMGGLISKPTTHFLGAMMHKDFKALHRSYLAYGAMNDSMSRAFSYMGQIYSKASKNVDDIAPVTRRDLLLKHEADLDLLREVAKSREAEGNWGLSYIVQQMESLSAFGKDPVVRFGPNGLISTDGFTGAMTAHSEAYFRAMEEFVDAGKPLTRETLKPVVDKHYAKMFDNNGLIKDEAAKWTNNELALNLDSPMVDGIDGFAKHFAFMKPFLMFPTTGANRITMFGKYAPWATFQKDYNQLAFTPLKQLLGNEEFIDDMLRQRGIDITNMSSLAKANRITDLKYEAMGRKALGTAAVAGVFAFFQDDRITGDGHYDKETQAARVRQGNWKPRSFKGLDGKHYSYNFLGPIADWVAATVNVFDNFDTLGASGLEEFGPKMAFVLSASITDNTGLSTVRPLLEMLSGNEGARNRFAAGFVNGLGPLAGQRGEWSRVFTDGLRIVENDFYAYLGNQNRFAEGILGTTSAPVIYSPVSGKKANSYGFMQRAWNAYTAIPIHAESSPEEEFLNHVEYDVSTTFRTKEGVKVPPAIQSELFRIMGEDKIFQRGIQEVMKSVKDWKSLQSFEEMRAKGEEVDIKKWHNIHARLRQAQQVAEQSAYRRLNPELQKQLITAQVEKLQKDQASQLGQPIQESLNIRY
jgi:hypothetical protein|tara:strand:+ start:3487 stop:7461 length:3975 start_codon:yes stop_codon:yes gene_type:complete